MWFKTKELESIIKKLEGELNDALKTIAVLDTDKAHLTEQLEYTKSLLANELEAKEPDETDSSTIRHEQASAPRMPTGWKPFSKRKKDYEAQHSKGVTGRQQRIKANVAAMQSDPRSPIVEK